jgi:hypothetical protein
VQTVIYSVEVTRRAYYLVSELRRNGVRDFRVLTPPASASSGSAALARLRTESGAEQAASADSTGPALDDLPNDLATLARLALERGRAVIVIRIDPGNRSAVDRLVLMCCAEAEALEPPPAMPPPPAEQPRAAETESLEPAVAMPPPPTEQPGAEAAAIPDPA